jgi:hypothetical protein
MTAPRSWLSKCEPFLNYRIISENLNNSTTYCFAQSWKQNVWIRKFGNLISYKCTVLIFVKSGVRVSDLSWSAIYQHCFDISWLADEAKWDHVVEDSTSFILLLSLRHAQLSQFLSFHKGDWLLSCFVELYTSSIINVYYASKKCLRLIKMQFHALAHFQFIL